MAKVKLPKRFDRILADEGQIFNVYDPSGNHWGDFTLRLFDQTLPRYRDVLTRMGKKYEKEFKTRSINDRKLSVEIFYEVAVVDWSGIPTEDGKEFECSLANALELFGGDDPDALWLFNFLAEQASDVTNFQPHVPEEVVKN